MPGVEWIITDEGVNVGSGTGSFTKSIGDNNAAFLGDVNDGSLLMYEGSEPIAEIDGGPETVKVGLASWSRKVANPTETQLFVLDNALSVDHGTKNIAYGTVIF